MGAHRSDSKLDLDYWINDDLSTPIANTSASLTRSCLLAQLAKRSSVLSVSASLDQFKRFSQSA